MCEGRMETLQHTLFKTDAPAEPTDAARGRHFSPFDGVSVWKPVSLSGFAENSQFSPRVPQQDLFPTLTAVTCFFCLVTSNKYRKLHDN